jgi:hypothetical protein
MAQPQSDLQRRIDAVDERIIREHVVKITGFGPRSPHDQTARRRTTQYLTTNLALYGYSV